MLEIHLRYVRSFLEDASRKVPPELGIDFDGVLQKISSVPLDPDATSHATSAPSASSDVIREKPSSHKAPGISHLAFLTSIVEILGDGPSAAHGLLERLFDVPLKESHAELPSLPPKKEAMEVIDSLFAAQHPMLIFLHEQYFRDTVELVYTAASRDEAIERFLPMLHIALALGYLFSIRAHRHAGCESVERKAMHHYLAGRNMLQPLRINSMIALQSLLCAIIFLISTCRIAQAHPLIGLAASLTMRLGLHANNAALPAGEKLLRLRALAAVVQVDIYTSMLLELPEFLQQAKIDFSRFNELEAKATEEGEMHVCASLRHLSLLKMCREKEVGGVDLKNGATELRAFKDQAQASFRTVGHNPQDQGYAKSTRLEEMD